MAFLLKREAVLEWLIIYAWVCVLFLSISDSVWEVWRTWQRSRVIDARTLGPCQERSSRWGRVDFVTITHYFQHQQQLATLLPIILLITLQCDKQKGAYFTPYAAFRFIYMHQMWSIWLNMFLFIAIFMSKRYGQFIEIFCHYLAATGRYSIASLFLVMVSVRGEVIWPFYKTLSVKFTVDLQTRLLCY